MYGLTSLFLRLVPARATVCCYGRHNRVVPVFCRAHWRRVATRRDSRRDKVSLRKRYGCHPGIARVSPRAPPRKSPGTIPRVSPGAPPGVPPRVSLGAPPRVSPGVPPNAQRCAAQSATSCKPAYHPRHCRLLTRESLGTPQFVARNATGRWLECWRVARVIVHARSLSDDVVAIDVIAVVVAVFFFFFLWMLLLLLSFVVSVLTRGIDNVFIFFTGQRTRW